MLYRTKPPSYTSRRIALTTNLYIFKNDDCGFIARFRVFVNIIIITTVTVMNIIQCCLY